MRETDIVLKSCLWSSSPLFSLINTSNLSMSSHSTCNRQRRTQVNRGIGHDWVQGEGEDMEERGVREDVGEREEKGEEGGGEGEGEGRRIESERGEWIER